MSDDKFNTEVQSILLSYMVTDHDMFSKCQNILNPDHFDQKLRPAVRFLLEYADKYRSVPVPDVIRATTGVAVDFFPAPSTAANEWFLTTVEEFTRYKALEHAILEGVTLLQKGKGADIERLIKEAQAISLMRDLGTDYFHDPMGRIVAMKDRTRYISTGWSTMDQKLYGGFTPGSLNIFAGGSGSGKSLLLQNLALNWVFEGKNVIYFTLELSEDLVAARLDAMVAGCEVGDVFRETERIALVVKMAGHRSGKLTIKKLPEAGTTSNDLRAFMKEYEIKTGYRPDAICVDYLDLMHPNNRTINPSDLFVKDKYVSEELRAIASDYQFPLGTASQLNRASVEAQNFDHSHIAGGISKINTADNVMAILATAAMKERGIYQLQFLKTRSSSAVGSYIELAFDPKSLRITDQVVSAQDMKPKSQADIRAEAAKRTAEEAPKIAKPAKNGIMRTCDHCGTASVDPPFGQWHCPACGAMEMPEKAEAAEEPKPNPTKSKMLDIMERIRSKPTL